MNNPCPFCGCQAVWLLKKLAEHKIERDQFWVQCAVCHAKGPPQELEGMAVPMWNRRNVIPDAPDAPNTNEDKWPNRSSLKFHGSCQDLIEKLTVFRGAGSWNEETWEKHTFAQFRHNNGGVMNWYPSTGKILFQGTPEGRELLKALVTPHIPLLS